MFFELHKENKIGYKLLSEADLGTGTSHQTHIGLSGNVLQYLGSRDILSENAIFIYENNFDYIDAYFDRIQNPDQSFRSPKIRTGDSVSIVSTIREKVQSNSPSLKWYLIWFGLKNEKLVFFLFNNTSDDYQNISSFLDLSKTGAKTLTSDNPIFRDVVQYIESRINKNATEVLKELEIVSQIENIKPNKYFKKYDIEKINAQNSQTGRLGEELINSYFNYLQNEGEILTYQWYNETTESGYPYDFTFQDKFNNVIYLDVKTTGYNFSQGMVFSSQEMKFISETYNNYNVYRVYRDEQGYYKFNICSNLKKLALDIHNETVQYSHNLTNFNVKFKGSKLIVSPNDLQFSNPITLQSY